MVVFARPVQVAGDMLVPPAEFECESYRLMIRVIDVAPGEGSGSQGRPPAVEISAGTREAKVPHRVDARPGFGPFGPRCQALPRNAIRLRLEDFRTDRV